MQRDKAIVIATGEIVTLHYSKERDGDVYYAILEDANRLFIPDELRIIDDKWSFIFKWLLIILTMKRCRKAMICSAASMVKPMLKSWSV